MNNSLTFQLCKLICGYSQLTILNVSNKLLISRAHAYRIVKELNSILVFYDTSIEINEDSILTLTGEELAIRTFIYDFVLQCVPHDEWIFTTTSKLELQSAILPFYPIPTITDSHHQVFVFFAILKNRLKTQNYLPEIKSSRSESYLENFECFSKKEVIDFFIAQKLRDKKLQHTEYLYLSFFSSIYLKAFLPDNKLNVGTNLFNSNDPEHVFLKKLIENWAQEFDLSLTKSEKIKMLYSCSVQYGLTVLMKTKPFKIWYLENQINPEELVVDGDLGQKILDFLLLFVDENMPVDIQNEVLSPLILKNFYTMFYLETLNQKHQTVSIYLYFTKNINAKEFLHEFLKKIYNVSTMFFLEDEKNADIIITDCYDISSQENQEMIILTDYLSKTQLTNLMEAINVYYLR